MGGLVMWFEFYYPRRVFNLYYPLSRRLKYLKNWLKEKEKPVLYVHLFIEYTKPYCSFISRSNWRFIIMRRSELWIENYGKNAIEKTKCSARIKDNEMKTQWEYISNISVRCYKRSSVTLISDFLQTTWSLILSVSFYVFVYVVFYLRTIKCLNYLFRSNV